MNDAYTIGITLALEDGVSDGIAVIRQDLASLDAAIAGSMAGLATLRAAAEGIGGLQLDAATVRLIGQKLLGPVPRPTTAPAQPSPAPNPTAPEISAAPSLPIRMPARQVPATDDAARPARETVLASPPETRMSGPGAPQDPIAQAKPLPVAPTPLADPAPLPGMPTAPFQLPLAPPASSTPAPIAQMQPPARAVLPATHTPRALGAADLQAFARGLSPAPAPAAPDVVIAKFMRGPSAGASDVLRTAPASDRPREVPPAESHNGGRARLHTNERRVDRIVTPAKSEAPPTSRAPVALAPLVTAPPPSAPSMSFQRAPIAPLPRATESGGTSPGGDVFLDGTLLGRWMAEHLAQEAGRPPAGLTGFDPRMTRIWPGPPIGN